THGYVDMWSPIYLAFISPNHNSLIRMYEIQGFSSANTETVRINIAQDQNRREWYRPWPASGEFEWSLRNNTNYGETGVLTALQYTSTFPKIVVENFYQKSRNSIDAARKDSVAGYLIPIQRDPTRVAVLVNLLRMQG